MLLDYCLVFIYYLFIIYCLIYYLLCCLHRAEVLCVALSRLISSYQLFNDVLLLSAPSPSSWLQRI